MYSFSEMCRKMFKVGCIGFGGGNAVIPILEEAFIDTDDNGESAAALDRDVVVANVTPGALPVEIVGSLGRRTHGIRGMVAAPIMFTLPGILGTLILLLLMSGLQEESMNIVLVGAAGISAFICSLLIEYMRRVFISAREESRLRTLKIVILVICVTVLISGGNLFKIIGTERTPFFGLSTLSLLLAVFFWTLYVNNRRDWRHLGIGAALTVLYLVGSGKNDLMADTVVFTLVKLLMTVLALWELIRSIRANQTIMKIDSRGLTVDVLVWIGFAILLSAPSVLITPWLNEFPIKSVLSTLMSFGGGDAYLSIADGMFVDSGMISEAVFYGQIVTVVNVLPGSILCKCLFGMGFYIGNQAWGLLAGIALGLCGYACSVATSCGIFFLIQYFYEALTAFESFNFLSRWVRPIVVGLLIKVMLGLVSSNIALSTFSGRSVLEIVIFMAVLTAANYMFRRKRTDKNIELIIADIVAAMLFMLM